MAENGYDKGNSGNLPYLNIMAVAAFISASEKFVGAELRGVKNFRAGRESYGDDAVGYVQLQRIGDICTIKARVTPEHKVRSKCYRVDLVMDEASGVVTSVTCHDCAASAGGCKHAIALLMWVNRRSEDPSPTSIECYWRKSKLSGVGTVQKFIKTSQLGTKRAVTSRKNPVVRREPGSFLAAVLDKGKGNILNSQLHKHFGDIKPLEYMSLNNLAFWYLRDGGNSDSADDFIKFCSGHMTADRGQIAAKATSEQTLSSSWHSLRFARITASKVFEASRCKTADGSLVESIFGSKIPDSKYMKRGRDLEAVVLKIVEQKVGRKFYKIGLVLSGGSPMIGASPDAVCEDLVVEVKCPASEATVSSYVKNGELTPKCCAQIQLQMHLTGKKNGLFCVACPKFELTSEVTVYPVTYNATYSCNLVENSMLFWKLSIFPKLMSKNTL